MGSLTNRGTVAGTIAGVVAGLALAATLLAACTSGTNGSGHHGPTTGGATGSGPTATGPTGPTGPSSPTTSTDLTPSVSGTSSAGSKTVDVIITRAGWDPGTRQVTANAIIPGAVISGGTCTLTLTMGATNQVATRSATPTADSTQCGVLAISEPAAGTWTAVVSFAAAGTSGTSSPVPVTVTG